MNKILTAFEKAALIVLGVIVLGLLPCTFISMFISIFTDVTFKACVLTIPFWIGTMFGIFAAGMYINCELENNHS